MPRAVLSCASQPESRTTSKNRTTERAGALNVFMPGGFEVMMPAIVEYFAERER